MAVTRQSNAIDAIRSATMCESGNTSYGEANVVCAEQRSCDPEEICVPFMGGLGCVPYNIATVPAYTAYIWGKKLTANGNPCSVGGYGC